MSFVYRTVGKKDVPVGDNTYAALSEDVVFTTTPEFDDSYALVAPKDSSKKEKKAKKEKKIESVD
jgi:hypothetical protein